MVKVPDNYNPADYPPVAVTVDVALFTIRAGHLAVLLIERKEEPYKGHWALPGGFIEPSENLLEAAARELSEESGMSGFAGHLEQLGSYGDPKRDPRMRIVSVAHLGIVPDLPLPAAGSDAARARFWPVEDLGLFKKNTDAPMLAFDHQKILKDALERVASKLEYTSLATAFVEEPFTLSDLRRVYEAVWGRELDPANFQRKVLQTKDFVLPASGQDEDSGKRRGRPARLYKKGSASLLHPAMLRNDSNG